MKIYQVEVEGWHDYGNHYHPRYEFYTKKENAEKRRAESEYIETVVLVTSPKGYTQEYPKWKYDFLVKEVGKTYKVELATIKKYRYRLTEYETMD